MGSGKALVVSSVTYMTGTPRRMPEVTASSVRRVRAPIVQLSPYLRLMLHPRDVLAAKTDQAFWPAVRNCQAASSHRRAFAGPPCAPPFYSGASRAHCLPFAKTYGLSST